MTVGIYTPNTLSLLFPAVYEVAKDRYAFIGDYWHRGRWKLALIRNDNIGQSQALRNLKASLTEISSLLMRSLTMPP